MRLRHFTLLLLLSLTFSAINAQESQSAPSPKPAANDEQWSSFQAINATLDTILMQYEQLDHFLSALAMKSILEHFLVLNWNLFKHQ
jgi:hypothetical protein